MSDAPPPVSIQELQDRLAELIARTGGGADAAALGRQIQEVFDAFRLRHRVETEALARDNAQARNLLEQFRRRSAVTVHDLKAPITISLLNLELLEMERDPSQSAFYLSGVRRELEFMLDTIANLLELERAPGEGEPVQFEPVPLSQLVEGVIGRMSVLIADKPDLRLENAIPRGLPPLRAHPHRLTRVFNNLFSNSIKYTERGHVRASAELGPERSLLRVVVEDTGNGIDAQRLGKLFNYYQGDSERAESTGIGLAFVKQVVDAHQGKVWIESERGKGTRVYVQLPTWIAPGPN